MVRKAPATNKHKGSRKNETYLPGITENADVLQQLGNMDGKALDKSVAANAKDKNAADVMDVPVGGLNSDIAAPVNSE